MKTHKLFHPALVIVISLMVTTQCYSFQKPENKSFIYTQARFMHNGKGIEDLAKIPLNRSTAQNDVTTLSGVKATYAAPPLNDNGSINMNKLLKELKDLHANTYHWLIAYNEYFGLEQVKRFLPMAARENINVWVTILPPSEQPALGWSEPYRLDFEKWAEELATLSLAHKNLVAWSVDDFGQNQNFFTPAYVGQFTRKAKGINPNFKFVPCIYYSYIKNVFVEKYISLFDGILFPYRAESDGGNLKDPSLVEKEITEIRSRIKTDIPIILDIYATGHSSLGETTPEYIATILELGMKSADGITIYCHQNPVTAAGKCKIIRETFSKN